LIQFKLSVTVSVIVIVIVIVTHSVPPFSPLTLNGLENSLGVICSHKRHKLHGTNLGVIISHSDFCLPRLELKFLEFVIKK